jgi:hypothetical protein
MLDETMAAIDAAVHPHPPAGAGTHPGAAPSPPSTSPASQLLRQELIAAVRRTDDCVRKPVLAAWLMRGGGAGIGTG